MTTAVVDGLRRVTGPEEHAVIEFLNEVTQGPADFVLNVAGVERILISQDSMTTGQGELGRTAPTVPEQLVAVRFPYQVRGGFQHPRSGDAVEIVAMRQVVAVRSNKS